MRRLAIVIATVGGTGYLPAAPGTAGSLVGAAPMLLLAHLRARRPGLAALVLLALIALAIWAAGVAAAGWGVKDDQRIVVDEVAGMLVAGVLLPGTAAAALLAFVLFRVFDVWKPPPIRQLERLPGGLGVVADDLLAGLYAGVVARVLLLAVA